MTANYLRFNGLELITSGFRLGRATDYFAVLQEAGRISPSFDALYG
jgi:hypothetical protein